MSEGAFIDVRQIARVEAFWWVGGPGAPALMDGDWMAIIYRPMGGGQELQFKYRFRYYKDERAFHSDDAKSHYTAKFGKDKLAEAIQAADEMAATMLLQFGGKIYRKRFVDGTKDKFQRWMLAQPFAHRTTPAEYNRTRPQ